jgi:hypothetical protein
MGAAVPKKLDDLDFSGWGFDRGWFFQHQVIIASNWWFDLCQSRRLNPGGTRSGT